MSRKVIQVVSDQQALVVLCDDGTMWQQVGSGWQQIPGPTECALAAEVVAELRRMVTEAHREFDAARDRFDAGLSTGYHESARIVAEKLGGK